MTEIFGFYVSDDTAVVIMFAVMILAAILFIALNWRKL